MKTQEQYTIPPKPPLVTAGVEEPDEERVDKVVREIQSWPLRLVQLFNEKLKQL